MRHLLHRDAPDGHFASSSDGSRCRSAGDVVQGVGEGGATQVAFEHARTRCSARTGELKDAGRRRSCVQVASPEFRDTDDTGGKEAPPPCPVDAHGERVTQPMRPDSS